MARARDDGARGERGLCISIRSVGRDIELTLDSVRLDQVSRAWHHDVFITFANVDREQAARFDFSEKQLADFGRMALGALLG